MSDTINIEDYIANENLTKYYQQTALKPVKVEVQDGEVTISRDGYSVTFQYTVWDAWRQGVGYIQDVFKDFNEDDREFIMTGITPQEWEDMFGENE